MDLDDADPRHLLGRQSGVVARRQLAAVGVTPGDLERMVRRRELVRLLPGIFVDHTGPPSWRQRAWAGVLCVDGGALAGGSALRAAGGDRWRRTREGAPIEVAVPRKAWRPRHPGYRFTHRSGLTEDARWNASPPRLRVEQAVLDEVARESAVLERVGLLTDAVQSGLTTPGKLLDAVDARSRVAGRQFVLQVLGDLQSGTCSVLEWAYRRRVARAHGLPIGEMQVFSMIDGVLVIRDVVLADLDLAVELDGRAFHSGAERFDADLERDLAAQVAEGLTTVRLGYGQVVARPCRTAGWLARLLTARGWTGRLTACGPECSAEVLTCPGRQDLGADH